MHLVTNSLYISIKTWRATEKEYTLFSNLHKRWCIKVLHSMSSNLENLAVDMWLKLTKRLVFITISKKDNIKECSNYCTIALISNARKVMLKILQARLQKYVNQELPDVQARFRKGRGSRDQIVNVQWIIEKAKEF